jgi:hypothetical protein
MLHKNLTHQICANRKKMISVLELHVALFLQSKIGFVHQVGALQRVIRPFLAQVAMSDSAQFSVNEWDRGVQGLMIAGVPVRQ